MTLSARFTLSTWTRLTVEKSSVCLCKTDKTLFFYFVKRRKGHRLMPLNLFMESISLIILGKFKFCWRKQDFLVWAQTVWVPVFYLDGQMKNQYKKLVCWDIEKIRSNSSFTPLKWKSTTVWLRNMLILQPERVFYFEILCSKIYFKLT